MIVGPLLQYYHFMRLDNARRIRTRKKPITSTALGAIIHCTDQYRPQDYPTHTHTQSFWTYSNLPSVKGDFGVPLPPPPPLYPGGHASRAPKSPRDGHWTILMKQFIGLWSIWQFIETTNTETKFDKIWQILITLPNNYHSNRRWLGT